MLESRLTLWPWVGGALGLAVADQLTKAWATASLAYGVPWPVVPGFNLTLLHNTGAAFSLLAQGGGWQRWFFMAIAIGAALWILASWRAMPAGARWAPTALMLVLGGAIGNCWDRMALGYVVDFIQLCYSPWCFPAFNLADSGISVGAFMIAWELLRDWRAGGAPVQ